MTSQIKTLLLLGLLTGLILLLGAAAGGRAGLFIALAVALGMNFFSYWYSDRIVLTMYKARELSPGDAPALHRMVGELAASAGIPKPRLMLIPQPAPNAFATGRNPHNAVVAVTEGLVRLMPPEELRGVLAHEMGHIKNHDILIQSVAAVLATAIMFFGNMLRFTAIFGGMRSNDGEGGNPFAALALAILAPIAALLIQMAISRSREYLADATGAGLDGDPRHLATALQRLDAAAKQIPLRGNPSTENMFIVSPFAGGLGSLFSTHPPVEDRVRRLLALRRDR